MYIDGVFSGGGIKGLALVGAYQAIEEKGLQFKDVAGTSAGSIVASFIAAGYNSQEIYKLLHDMDFIQLLDRRATFIPTAIAKWIHLYWRLGLYKGNKLEEWVAEKLLAKGIRTFADIPPFTLRIITSDLTNNRLTVLPNDLPSYGIDPRRFPVAKAIRMSCSLPYFFEPVKLKSSLFVDGGVLSNFPMWLFDTDNVKKVRPVIGIQLSPSIYERPRNNISNAIQLFEGLFQTMKDAHDSRYISRKHEKNIIFIPTEGILTTDFDLSDEQKEKLFQLGYERAKKYLTTWC